MYEMEIKVRTPHEPVRDRLPAIGAEPTKRYRQTDTYYDSPVRDFAETDEALRLRLNESGSKTETHLAYKGPKLDPVSKTRVEHETAIDDADRMRSILTAIGFEPVATVKKTRERFEIDEYTVTLDRVADLGEFVEIETTLDAQANLEAARRRAVDLLGDLGIDAAAQIRRSYLELLLEGDNE